MSKVLITGGSGLVGVELTNRLKTQGSEVIWLVRKRNVHHNVMQIQWDELDAFSTVDILKSVHTVVHLAGAGLFDKRWSNEYKKQIVDSRVGTLNQLLDVMNRANIRLECLISASGIAAYGNKITDRSLDESLAIDTESFLGNLVHNWEQAADQFSSISKRVIKARFGIVLSTKGGAFPQFANKVLGTMVYLGSGNQYANWIHIEDLCAFLSDSITHEKRHGIYNLVAPNNCTHFSFMKKVAQRTHSYLIPIGIPSFVLKTVLGAEKAEVIVGGGNVSAERIIKSGFQFKYPTLDDALKNLIE